MKNQRIAEGVCEGSQSVVEYVYIYISHSRICYANFTRVIIKILVILK